MKKSFENWRGVIKKNNSTQKIRLIFLKNISDSNIGKDISKEWDNKIIILELILDEDRYIHSDFSLILFVKLLRIKSI